MAKGRSCRSKGTPKSGAKKGAAEGAANRKIVAADQKRDRRTRGRSREAASFPVAPTSAELPGDYLATLADIKRRIQAERLRVVVAANTAMVGLYWDIGRLVLDRQSDAGGGDKVIDRLSTDQRTAYPDMRGFSTRNLKYMRASAAASHDAEIVRRVVTRVPWRRNIALLEGLDDFETRLRYAEQALQHGWSQPILRVHIETTGTTRVTARPSPTSPRPCRQPTRTWPNRSSRTRTSSTSSGPPILDLLFYHLML